MKNKNKIGGFIVTENDILVVVFIVLASIGTYFLYSSQQSKWIAAQLECKKDCETTVVVAENGKKILTNKEGRQTIIDKDNEIIEVIQSK
jgi:ABC-type thiamine transport system substrate-binding protein